MKEKEKIDLNQFDSKKIEKKLRLISDLFEMAFQMKCFCLKKKYPNLEEKEIIKRAYALIEQGCT